MESPRKPYIYEAIISFLFLIVIMGVGIVGFGSDPHIPMLIGTAFVALMAIRLGYKWQDIEQGMINGIIQALQSVIILAIIGVLIGVWLLSGVVPTMIYYGLNIISPTIFLVATVLICSITSIATGTSWGTAGTIGIALMGVAKGLNIPAPIAAGAIISGAYFGDKISPLSDTTNLAPAMAGTDVFTHAKYMIKSNSITYIITIIFFLVIGFRFGGKNVDLSAIEQIQSGLYASFNISPMLLLPPIIVIILVAKKMPAIPGIFVGVILGMIFAPIFQGANLGNILSASYSGYVSETGIATIDELLTAGGLEGMMYSISLTIIAMMFGGIMEKTGQLEVIVNALLKRIKGVGGLVTLTTATCVASNITMPEQYISIVVPGRMYAKTYREKGLHPKTLSNVLESAGTITAPLIPWNTCGAFMYSVLGVSATSYGKWAIMNYSTPILVIVLAFMGSKLVIEKIEDDPETIIATAD
ncbi:Na+/H+ antiporter NhaC [Schnuerera sp. xch1]|uniref:Na+/H+ antiporter NhaC n=1 Tax=Schnuerera sp. xch1 TaxID=2874283 RepID=UPI001CC10F1D|nr:Na+/H+ antiporter NhaC [Schnuerera sp. xch1]MBZ2175032.1 Na+/H+ antiporter NhaC [Schnuerera sp. xch1]